MLIVKKIQQYIKVNNMDKKKQKFIDKVDEGFRYFDGFRLEELKEDDRYYINTFMIYIEHLEISMKKVQEQLKEANEILST